MAIRDITQNKAYQSRMSNTTPTVQSQPTVTQPVANPTTPKVQQNFGIGSAEGGRLAPTVATPKQPVISKTLDTSLTYDPTDPQDYLMRLQARTTSGKLPTETEYYNALKAQNALKSQQAEQANPLQSTLDGLLAQQSQLKGQETTMDTAQLDAYKRSLEQQYGSQREELLAGAERQKQSAQGVYSFSGFGRSTAAADKMVEIQKSTDNAINVMNAAKEAAIIAKQAELAGADSASLSELNKRIAQYQDEANKRQIESLKKTAEANQSTGASYIESLNNLMQTAAKSGMDIGKPEDIQLYAQLARRPDGSINEEFISALPEGMQAIIRTANISSSPEAAKTVTVGSGKSARVFQRNPATGKYDIPVGSGGAGGYSGGGGGIAGSGVSTATGGLDMSAVQAKDKKLVELLGQYKGVLDETSYLGLKTDAAKQAQAQNLLSQITAEYKNAKKLGTLDTGVQRLIDGLVGKGGGLLSLSSYSNEAQSNAVKGFIESLGGQVATPSATPTSAPKTTPVTSNTKRASIFN